MAPASSTPRSASGTAASRTSNKLPWERFDELARAAFGDAGAIAGTRFFLKTRILPRTTTVGDKIASDAADGTKQAKGKSKRASKRANAAVEIVARVSTPLPPHARSGAGGSTTAGSSSSSSGAHAPRSFAYRTTVASNLSRLTRLLRFVMQEVLGPMTPAPAAAAAADSAPTLPATTSAAAPEPSKSAGAGAAASKKKKSKGGKHK